MWENPHPCCAGSHCRCPLKAAAALCQVRAGAPLCQVRAGATLCQGTLVLPSLLDLVRAVALLGCLRHPCWYTKSRETEGKCPSGSYQTTALPEHHLHPLPIPPPLLPPPKPPRYINISATWLFHQWPLFFYHHLPHLHPPPSPPCQPLPSDDSCLKRLDPKGCLLLGHKISSFISKGNGPLFPITFFQWYRHNWENDRWFPFQWSHTVYYWEAAFSSIFALKVRLRMVYRTLNFTDLQNVHTWAHTHKSTQTHK